jgi:hypothetical protein
MMERTLLGNAWITEHDRREIAAFRRFLNLAGPPADPGVPRRYPGWIPYILGHFFWSGVWGPHERSLHPPEGFDEVPVTAWTLPG